MSNYLTPDHPDAFVDHPTVEEKRAVWDKLMIHAPLGTCPLCKGHGGWNLALNAYPLRDRENTRENRHKYVHFRASCRQCNGWGFVVEQRDLDCIHTREETKHDNVRCLTDYRCTKCGKTEQIDSSD